MDLHHTYELYISGADASPDVKVVTCSGTDELHREIDALLARPDVTSVEVRQGGEHLYAVDR